MLHSLRVIIETSKGDFWGENRCIKLSKSLLTLGGNIYHTRLNEGDKWQYYLFSKYQTGVLSYLHQHLLSHTQHLNRVSCTNNFLQRGDSFCLRGGVCFISIGVQYDQTKLVLISNPIQTVTWNPNLFDMSFYSKYRKV